MKHCSRARRWFGAYWDDEITQAEREWVDAHFAECDACRTEYAQLAHTLESVAALPRLEASPDFVERTLSRARRASTADDALQVPRPVWVPVAVAASLLIVVATLLSPWEGRDRGPSAVRSTHPQEAQLVSALTPPATPLGHAASGSTVAQAGAMSQEQVAALVDSLIDHSADVDFVLDPVRVGRERTAGRLLSPVQGQQAVINF